MTLFERHGRVGKESRLHQHSLTSAHLVDKLDHEGRRVRADRLPCDGLGGGPAGPDGTAGRRSDADGRGDGEQGEESEEHCMMRVATVVGRKICTDARRVTIRVIYLFYP